VDPLLKDLKPKRHTKPGYTWDLCKVRGTKGIVAKRVAASLAHRIARRRLPTAKLELWTAARDAKVKLSDAEAQQIRVILGPDFGNPNEPPIPDHLQGAVSEALWFEFVSNNQQADRTIERIEAHGYTVTDAGGDGLVVYRTDVGDLTFRLWEIKKHTSEQEVRDTATRAHRQLDTRALDYLARFTGVHSQLVDGELREFYSQLVDYWQQQGPEAGAGVAVSTTLAGAPRDIFETLPIRFPGLKPRLEALLNGFSDYASFCNLVRDEIWKGL